MRQHLLLLLCILGLSTKASAQTYTLTGAIADSSGAPISYTTVTLLDPKDSTLVHFGISTQSGSVEIKDVTPGEYLLQAAHNGYNTFHKRWKVPQDGSFLGLLRLTEKSIGLEEINVVGEKVPISFNKDTLEYNAAAFKVKPDANVEELLKKLPGVQVNRNGEIEAQGKTVNKVLVDGKEFFGNDPKMATRNLPADAIKKVQVYDGGSDEARFSGIDDGQRDKTINLSLKDSKKTGSFGDVTAGSGTDERFKASAKWYRFRPGNQLATLGMLNNINQFGFTLSDYMNFQGGMMDGGSSTRMNARDAKTYPVDFGIPTVGAITSGAAGINYATEPKTKQRFNINYLGNGADRRIDRSVYSRNSTDRGLYEQRQTSNEKSDYTAHRFNSTWRNEHDSTTQLILAANGEWQQGKSATNSNTASSMAAQLVNQLSGWNASSYNEGEVNLLGSYQKKFGGAWPIVRVGAEARYAVAPSREEWRNYTEFFPSVFRIENEQYQDNDLTETAGSARLSAVRDLKGGFYLEPELRAGIDRQNLLRNQGSLARDDERTDSLSFDFSREYRFARAGFGLQKNSSRSQLNVALRAEAGSLQPLLAGASEKSTEKLFLLPSVSWHLQPKTGMNLRLEAGSEVQTPDAEQLVPVPTIRNPLYVRYGNPDLTPSLAHRFMAHLSRFDQFSFRFFSLHTNWSYVQDAIGARLQIRPDLSQTVTSINVPYRARGRVGANFNTPIRPLGLTFNTRLSEGWDESIGYVNDVQNTQTAFSHELELRFENRKKKVLDWQVGGSVQMSDARYSVNKALNNRYYRVTGFTQLSAQPTDRFYIGATADLNFYTASNFPEAVWVPLLRAEASYSFLKSKRGSIILEGYDLLNRNTGVQRTSQQNQLIETRSNVIGRYVLLSFRYKLNKFGGEGTGSRVRVQTIRE